MSEQQTAPGFGFAPDEIDPAAPTRAARLKWVVVVNADLPAGQAVNAAVCVAAATAPRVTGLLGEDTDDASGTAHLGLPWAGCTILQAGPDTLRAIRGRTVADPRVLIADMPTSAQHTRVYTDFLDAVRSATVDEMDYSAISLIGPRKIIDKVVGRLPLMP